MALLETSVQSHDAKDRAANTILTKVAKVHSLTNVSHSLRNGTFARHAQGEEGEEEVRINHAGHLGEQLDDELDR